jgi:hypothetical protein
MFFGHNGLVAQALVAVLLVTLALVVARLADRGLSARPRRYDVRAYLISMADYRSQSNRPRKPKLANLELSGATAAAYVRREHASQPFEDGRGVVAR